MSEPLMTADQRGRLEVELCGALKGANLTQEEADRALQYSRQIWDNVIEVLHFYAHQRPRTSEELEQEKKERMEKARKLFPSHPG